MLTLYPHTLPDNISLISNPHIPVLLNEVVQGLQVRSGGVYIDGTVGAGGHAAAIMAPDLVTSLPDAELADLIYRYGEEPASRRIAHRIVEERQRQPITTTGQLAAIVSSALGGRVAGRTRNPIHPATRTFQALRIA